jgi:hypothetical protein
MLFWHTLHSLLESLLRCAQSTKNTDDWAEQENFPCKLEVELLQKVLGCVPPLGRQQQSLRPAACAGLDVRRSAVHAALGFGCVDSAFRRLVVKPRLHALPLGGCETLNPKPETRNPKPETLKP